MADQSTIASGIASLNTKATPTSKQGLTAIGSTRATALQLAGTLNDITGGIVGAGIILPTTIEGGPGQSCIAFNNNANPVKVYANGSQTIDGVAGATGVTLTNAKRAQFFLMHPDVWISAQLGVPSA